MNTTKAIATAALILTLAGNVLADGVPMMIPYSGSVAVNNETYTGNGSFKFAIVNDACVPNPNDSCQTLWSNDTSSSAGSEPENSVDLALDNGAFQVKLGDPGITGMSPIDKNVFNTPNTFLRVWFDDGTHGFQQLSGDRQLVSVPYAHRAQVADEVSFDVATQEELDAATSPSAAVPIGTVIDWWRPSANVDIPSGYQIADGGQIIDDRSPYKDSFTPNLIGRFTQGVSISQFDTARASNANVEGGSASHTHTTNLSHNHTVSGGNHDHKYDISHDHVLETFGGGAHKHKALEYYVAPPLTFCGPLFGTRCTGLYSGDYGTSIPRLTINSADTGTSYSVLRTPTATTTTPFNTSSETHTHDINLKNHIETNKTTTGESAHTHDVGSYNNSAEKSTESNNLPPFVGMLKLMRIF